MSNSEKISLGCIVRDVLTDFEGTATAIVDYITGCKQVLVTPQTTDKTKGAESLWFDIDRLQITAYNTPVMEHLNQFRSVDNRLDSVETYPGSMDTPPTK